MRKVRLSSGWLLWAAAASSPGWFTAPQIARRFVSARVSPVSGIQSASRAASDAPAGLALRSLKRYLVVTRRLVFGAFAMHIVMLIVAIAGGFGFWWFRLRQSAEAARDVVDAAERARGALRRRRFKAKVEGSTLTAVDDPALAAAIMMAGIAAQKGVAPSRKAEDSIRRHLATRIGVADPDGMTSYAVWAAGQVTDPNSMSRTLAKLWRERLQPAERQELLEMVWSVATVDGPPTDSQVDTLERLRERLELPPAETGQAR
jgi:uncharacterized tellurite resistance protein B-like protein